jgi:hypothetical protein
MKQINFCNQMSDLQWGNWSEFKKDFLETAYENTKCYHGDVFISFNQLDKFIADNKNKDSWQVLISFHESGSDFVENYFFNMVDDINKSDIDLYLHTMNRITQHKGKTIILTYYNGIVEWTIENNDIFSVPPIDK